jgi:hypothetical protein
VLFFPALVREPPRIWSNVPAYEPTAEPAKRDLVDWPVLASFQRSTQDRHENFISDAEVFQALPYAPSILPGLPVQLDGIESSRYNFSTPVGSVQFRNEPQGPFGQPVSRRREHFSG